MTMVFPTEARNATAPISELANCSGLELVVRLADGSIRRPPMAETLPFTLLPPEEGKVGLLATPEPRFSNLTNTVHGGWIMTMLDTVMALAAQTMSGAIMEGSASLSVQVDHCRGSMRARRSSTPARPYIARLRVFSLLIWPSA